MSTSRQENFKAHATLELRGQLASRMEEMYPSVQVPSILQTYLNGELTHVRFPVNNSSLMAAVLPVAIYNALQAGSARSIHGDEHVTYESSLRAMLEDNNIGRRTTQLQHNWYTHDLPSGNEHTISVERLVVEIGPFERHTYAPLPTVEADMILQGPNRNNQKFVDRQIRNLSLKHGMPAALVTAAHMGWEVADLQRAFRPELQRQRLRELGTNGNIIPDPGTKGSQLSDFYTMYGFLRSAMRYRDGEKELPRRSSAAIEMAVEVFGSYDAFSRQPEFEFHERRSLGTIPVVQMATAKAVFASATEEASFNAPSGLYNPARDEAIHELYGDQSTSKLITAYLEIHKVKPFGE